MLKIKKYLKWLSTQVGVHCVIVDLCSNHGEPIALAEPVSVWLYLCNNVCTIWHITRKIDFYQTVKFIIAHSQFVTKWIYLTFYARILLLIPNNKHNIIGNPFYFKFIGLVGNTR